MSSTTAPAHGATGFSRAAVEALSAQRAEPAWLRERRLQAWETFERLPLPDRNRDEPWRRTDISAIVAALPDLVPFVGPAAGSANQALVERLAGNDPRAGLVVHVNGYPIHADLVASVAQQGVILTDLATAIRQHPELIERYLMTECILPGDSKFGALHAALWHGGIFLYVPRGVEVELPLQVIASANQAALGVWTHNLVVLEANSRVTLVESGQSGADHAGGFVDEMTELIVRDGAQLRCVQLQEWDQSVNRLSTQRAVLGRDATINWLVVTLGARFSRADVQAFLNGPGASAEMLGLFFAEGRQFFDHHTMQIHNAPNASSDLLYKGTLNDSSRSVFSGLIQVAPNAQKTDSYQLNRNLLLSDKARADSIPNLEIRANDVRCTHGASVGPVDPEHLFYLMARGLSRNEATKLIVNGFFEPVVARIPLDGVRARLWQSIEQKMRL